MRALGSVPRALGPPVAWRAAAPRAARQASTAAARSGGGSVGVHAASLPPWLAGLPAIPPPAARREAVLAAVRSELPTREDAFYVVDLAELAHKYGEWCAQLPRARPFYAVKCNDDPQILAALAALGAGFDCASKGEMAAVLALGVPPSDIIFAHPAKQPSHLRYARERGVTRMTFDNEDELDKIAAHYPAAQCVLRILADDSASVCRLGLKFGAPLARVRALLSHARSLGLAVCGVSYHVGSGNGDAGSFAAAVRDARAAFDIGAELGHKMTLLDLGGGYPGSALGEDGSGSGSGSGGASAAPAAPAPPAASPYASHPTFPTIAAHVRAALAAHFPEGCGVSIIGEPGRFFVKSCSTLAVCIIGKRRTEDEGAGVAAGAPPAQRLNYYVNDGLYGSFNCNVYDHASPQPTLALQLSASGSVVAGAVLLTPQALGELAARDAAAAAAAAGSSDALAVLGQDGRAVARDALGVAYAEAFAGEAAAAAAREEAEEGALDQQQQQRLVMGGSGKGGGGGGGGSGSSSFSRDAGRGSAGHHQGSARREAHGAGAGAAAAAAPAAPLLHPTTLWGPTCDSFDKISDSVRMPELRVGDWIVYENMGAYTVAGSCNFNGFDLPGKLYLHADGRVTKTNGRNLVTVPA